MTESGAWGSVTGPYFIYKAFSWKVKCHSRELNYVLRDTLQFKIQSLKMLRPVSLTLMHVTISHGGQISAKKCHMHIIWIAPWRVYRKMM